MTDEDDRGPAPRDLVTAAISGWRDSLINLSRRNRLLNYQSARTATVEITGPDAERVRSDVARGRAFRFCSTVAQSGTEDADSPHMPVGEPAADVLYTGKDPDDLGRALRALARRSNRDFIDRGVWVLYLAFGTLTWRDADEQAMTGPLLLVPVRLVTSGPRQPPVLEAVDDDPVVNPTLALKLSEFGIRLPGVDEFDEVSLADGLDLVRAAVTGQEGWEVRDRVLLSCFSFHKEAMYRDLLEHEAQIAAHSVIRTIGGVGGEAGGSFIFEEIPEERIDAEAPPEETPLVRDADCSQRACVAAAVAGHSFVMDGPPGTGKSQTIANVIGALLREGRSVLFVSEKAAALDVVRDRLTSVGLGSYLLELHSHKATRKEVAIALGSALDNVAIAPAGMPRMALAEVAERRAELNAYADAINEPRAPLGYSLHEVLGYLARLDHVPAAPAGQLDPADLSFEAFRDIQAAAASLARAWRPAVEGSSFPWRGVTERESVDAVLYRADAALQKLTGITARNEPLALAFDLRRPSDAGRLAALLEHLRARPGRLPESWLTCRTLDESAATIGDLATDLAEIAGCEDAVTRAAGVAWRTLPDPGAVDAVHAVSIDSAAPPGLDLNHLTAIAAQALAERFSTDADMLDTRTRSVSGIALMLGLPSVTTFAEARDTLTVAHLAYEPDRPERGWLSPIGLRSARDAFAALGSAHARLAEAQAAARAVFSDAVLGADVDGLHYRYAHVHKGLRKLGGTYRADKKSLAALTQPGVAVKAAVSHLGLAVAWKRALADLVQTEASHAPTLGSYYRGTATDVGALRRALDHAEAALQLADTPDMSRLADHVAADAIPNPQLQGLITDCRRDLQVWQASLAPEPIPAGRPELLTLPLADAAAWLRSHLAPLRSAAELTRAVSTATGRDLDVSQARGLLALRAAAEGAHSALTAHASSYQRVCAELFDDDRSDITAIRAALAWAETARRLPTGTNTPLTPEQVKALAGAVPTTALRAAADEWALAKAGLLAVFAASRHAELAEELDDFVEAAELITALREDTSGRDEWLAYARAAAKLADRGLGAAVEFCVAQRVSADEVPQVIERTVLKAWADRRIADDPALATIRAPDRDELVAEYRALDRTLVASATSNIITAVNARRPRNDTGQSAIIRTEANKKKRHMPVRHLMEKAGTVIQAIKPCFMMSPLAVSQYLPADFGFDVVIFDEASQVSPGDAINCIYRGKALITAGDQQQLPPTNFFAAVTDDASEEWSEDDENAADFESILDLLKACGAYRSLTLRWHYRSRHEDLIAFSNASFYRGNLITFPAARSEGPDVGVELFKVDGVYRRGSSRDNPAEAVKVAERVIHHFDARPTFTLGVVTFSEAQAAAIEHAVELARAARPDLDRCFIEDRLDGFFVKSLESVQGDERDVMIFSIGYGPDENNKITMNFGPINKPGGRRRLNVAVTRARYRNEIISSISAADIPTASTNEGVLHLRRYLDFAARGPAALALDLSPGNNPGDAESPFEESVITTIRSWGYQVTPQVGVAKYRIDIGVQHPDHPGVYAVGVECDGAMYHSSKTARDRDRLREEVLRGLGWRLHRIWGTAWYRNRHAEEERLRTAIDAAITAPIIGRLSTTDETVPHSPVALAPATFDTTPDWATPYETAHLEPLAPWIDPTDPGSPWDMRAGIGLIAAVEGPVHIDVIRQRLRRAWFIGRIGSRIRDNIDTTIRLADVLRDGDFIYMPGQQLDGVRTPVPECTRTVEQVHDEELAAALLNLIRDTRGISHNELTAAIARLFGWTRRGADITARLNALVAQLTRNGTIAGTADALSLGTGR